jgi:hypothetical protein
MGTNKNNFVLTLLVLSLGSVVRPGLAGATSFEEIKENKKVKVKVKVKVKEKDKESKTESKEVKEREEDLGGSARKLKKTSKKTEKTEKTEKEGEEEAEEDETPLDGRPGIKQNVILSIDQVDQKKVTLRDASSSNEVGSKANPLSSTLALIGSSSGRRFSLFSLGWRIGRSGGGGDDDGKKIKAKKPDEKPRKKNEKEKEKEKEKGKEKGKKGKKGKRSRKLDDESLSPEGDDSCLFCTWKRAALGVVVTLALARVTSALWKRYGPVEEEAEAFWPLEPAEEPVEEAARSAK